MKELGLRSSPRIVRLPIRPGSIEPGLSAARQVSPLRLQAKAIMSSGSLSTLQLTLLMPSSELAKLQKILDSGGAVDSEIRFTSITGTWSLSAMLGLLLTRDV